MRIEKSGFLLKDVSETIENEPKEHKGGFLDMLLDTLGASLVGNILGGLTGDGAVRPGKEIVRAG